MDRHRVNMAARSWIKIAGERIRQSFSMDITINTKSNLNDLVTNIDRKTEKFFANNIKELFPGHFLYSEEGYGDKLLNLAGTVWILDPIDGTANFIHQKRNFAISLAIYHNGEPVFGYVYDVVEDKLYFAEKNNGAYINDVPVASRVSERPLQESLLSCNLKLLKNEENNVGNIFQHARDLRLYKCASLEIVYVGLGILDAFLAPRLSLWDIAGAKVFAEELQCVVTQLDGTPFPELNKGSVLVAPTKLQREILDQL
jgi:myo-inositol-1(or 4)-monophosphatase